LFLFSRPSLTTPALNTLQLFHNTHTHARTAADKLPSSSDLPDLSDSNTLDVGGVTANAGKTFSKGMFGSDKSSAAPAASPLAALSDLNDDVRDAADSYRDPAIATPQDKVAGAKHCLLY
jgi:hypothetical protein